MKITRIIMRTKIAFVFMVVLAGNGCHSDEELSAYFNFSSSGVSVPADGASTFRLSVVLPPDTDERIENVTFSCEESSKITSLQNGTYTVSKAIGIDAEASAVFVSNVRPGQYTMKACVTLNDKVYCEEVIVETTPVSNKGLSIRIVEDPDQWIADGRTEINIEVMVRYFDQDDRKFLISHSDGVIMQSAEAVDTQMLNAFGEKRLTFVTGDEAKNVRMQFSYSEFELDTILTLLPSYPDRMILLSSVDTYDFDSKADLRIFLDRQGEGLVSRNLQMVAVAYQRTEAGIVKVGAFDPPFLKTTASITNTPSAEVTFDVGSGASIDTLLPIWIKTEVVSSAGVGIVADSLSLTYGG